eukprot:1157046-Pelagomonas_calceolata.AAC.2
MVPGSVEDERMFSALKYLKSPQRSSLKEKHVNVVGCQKEAWTIHGIKECGEVHVLDLLASWGLDMTWVLGLSELRDVETFLLDGLVCMQSVSDDGKQELHLQRSTPNSKARRSAALKAKIPIILFCREACGLGGGGAKY